MSDTVERVLYNPKNGEMAVGIRLTFLDKRLSQELGNLEGYSVQLAPSAPDAWAIDNQDGYWLVVPTPLMRGVEDWGPL